LFVFPFPLYIFLNKTTQGHYSQELEKKGMRGKSKMMTRPMNGEVTVAVARARMVAAR